jgi:copper chaperone CopZ
MERLDFSVEGMSCTGCERTVTNAVEQVGGVRRVDADHETGDVEVTAENGDEAEIRRAIHDAGFDVSA